MDSDNEQVEQQTTVIETKPKVKKERTEAQKQATARALEALAKAREEKKKATTTTVKKVTKTTVTPKPPPNPDARYPKEPTLLAKDEFPSPVPARRQAPKESIKDELEAFKNEMRGMMLATAPKKKKKKVIISDSDSSDSSEEEIIVKKTTKAKRVYEKPPAPIPQQLPDNSEMLKSIFFRNM